MRDHPNKDPRSHRKPSGPAAGGRPRLNKETRGSATAKKDFKGSADLKPHPASRKKPPAGDWSRPKPDPVEAAPSSPEDTSARIAKVMARAGLCSRRDAEAWIGEGRVSLNGTVITSPAINVRNDDKITVDGEPLAQRARTRLFLFHKPRGLVTTEHDPEGRQTIFDFLREHWPQGPRVVSIGRLDINTEGLLLLTNDGGLSRVLELPSTGWVRRYRVRAKGETDQGILDQLRQGVTLEGVNYAGIEATLDRVQGANCWLTMALREGKNREIKRVLEHVGLEVNRLIRISFGPFQLGEIAEGAVDEVPTRVLRDQLGPTLAKAAGADFLSPMQEQAEPTPVILTGRRPESGARPARERPETPRRGRSDRAPKPREVERQNEERPDLKVKPPPRQRKHISVLRAEHGDAGLAKRKRIERHETADCSGRTVHVERLVTVDDKKQTRSKPSPGRHGRSLEDGRKKPAYGSAPKSKPAYGSASNSRTERDGSERPQRSRFAKSGDRPQGATKSWRTSEDKPARASGEGRPARQYERKPGEASRGPQPKGKAGQGRPGGRKPDRRGDGPQRPRGKS